MTALLEFDAVSKTFHKGLKSIKALSDVTFTIEEGEVFGFIGPNGAGKSTTIKIILNIINKYEGHVYLYGKSARTPASRAGVAYLPESPTLYDQLTPTEILQLTMHRYGISRNDATQWRQYWLERLSLTTYADRRICQLSKGNAQRTALAQALVVNPKLLVLDEPLSGLDPVGRKDVVDILLEYKQQGGAIFFTSHVLHDVERVADRFGFINNGKLITVRSPQELLSQQSRQVVIRYYCDHALTESKSLRKGEYQTEVTQEELPDWIAKLNQSNGNIIEIKPAASLENIFFSILNGDTT